MNRAAASPRQAEPCFGAVLAVIIATFASLPATGEDRPSRIWSAEFDGWVIEPFCGTPSSPLPPAFFQQGPAAESGGGGTLAVAPDGTVFIGSGTFIFRVSSAGRVELLAGKPGVSGTVDGPADRALFRGISLIAFDPKGDLYVLEQGSGRLRTIVPRGNGPWEVKTIVGSAGKGQRRDGPAEAATFINPCGMTIFDDGRIFFMDNDWLRVLDNGVLVTLNPKGGHGQDDPPWDEPKPLESAKFRMLFTSNCITSDGKNLLYVADMWNNVLREINLEKKEIRIVNGGPMRGKPGSGTPKGSDPFRDGPGMEMRFHPGGGVTTAWMDRATGNIYMAIADDRPHIRTPDGWVRTLKDEVGLPVARDGEGRIYSSFRGGFVRLRKLKPGEKPPELEQAKAKEEPLFRRAPFDPNTIPADVGRFAIGKPAAPPAINGKDDDACWKSSQFFRLRRPDGSAPPETTGTDLRMLADERNFYLFARCREPIPAELKGPERNRDDDGFWNDDYLEIFLLPGLDPREPACQIMINPKGQTWDGRGRNAKEWNPKLEVKTAMEEAAWTVEIAVPLSEVPGGAGRGLWRVNVGRSRPKRGSDKAQETSWSVLYSTNNHLYERFNVVAIEALGEKLP